jgi:hypothetical protein
VDQKNEDVTVSQPVPMEPISAVVLTRLIYNAGKRAAHAVSLEEVERTAISKPGFRGVEKWLERRVRF